MEISAKNIVITGGTGGIALALVQHLLKHGAQVVQHKFGVRKKIGKNVSYSYIVEHSAAGH